jgi:hypothetical protein
VDEVPVNNATSGYPSLAILPDGGVLCVYRRYSDSYLVQRKDTSYYSIPIGSFPVQLGAGIIEVGENSNGTWIKWSDGTMVHYNQKKTISGYTDNVSLVSGLYYSYYDLSNNYFPSNFLAGTIPAVVMSQDQPGALPETYVIYNVANDKYSIEFGKIASSVYNPLSISEYAIIAIGRWK